MSGETDTNQVTQINDTETKKMKVKFESPWGCVAGSPEEEKELVGVAYA